MRAHFLKIVGILSATALFLPLLSPGNSTRRFYDDDPLLREPPPMNVENVSVRRISDYYDFFSNSFAKLGEQNTASKVTHAKAMNTLGDALDSAWYTQRHYWKPMTTEELQRGPGIQNAPDTSGRLTVVKAKTEGVSPGFTMEDSKGRRYNVKFDPLSNPEMATAADVIVSKFFHALGYNVPENYLFTFSRHQLSVAADATMSNTLGVKRGMKDRDVTELLLKAPRSADGRYRAVASFYIKGKNVGEFRYQGTRQDDPNDIVPHEHRLDLRGLGVFCAWLGHDDSRAINNSDFLTEGNGVHFIKHYLIDFGSTLGSASIGPNSPRSGQYLYDSKDSAKEFFSLGLYVPKWARAHYPKLPAVGRFEADTFDPETWVPEYRNPAFVNRLPDDNFWAAKQVMAFTDEQIRALVKLGQFSDPRAEKWIADCLILRRDKIGRAFFSKVLPLDHFAVQDGRLVFEDLAVKHGIVPPREYAIEWFRFDNETDQKVPLPLDKTFALPQAMGSATPGEYYGVHILAPDKKLVAVYLRKEQDGVKVVGIDHPL